MSGERSATGRVDRTGWPSGPWDDEPDDVVFAHAGYPCRIWRHARGTLCGYVGLPAEPDEPRPPDFPTPHGGIGYGGPVKGWDEAPFWVGFDCSHIGDLCPHPRLAYPGVYRDLAFVRQNVERMAEGYRAMAKTCEARTWRRERVRAMLADLAGHSHPSGVPADGGTAILRRHGLEPAELRAYLEET